MNRLPLQKRVRLLSLLMRGMSLRAASEEIGVSKITTAKLIRDVGQAAADYHNRTVRGLRPLRIECDEIWSFSYCHPDNLHKAKAPPPDAGEVYTWTALDTDSRLILTWAVGSRGTEDATAFMRDLRLRVVGRPQISTDGLASYVTAVKRAFGNQVDFAQLVKVTGEGKEQVVSGDPKHPISTSLIERHNLTIRMGMRRFTRRTNAHSKSTKYHRWNLAIFFAYYNFVRHHSTLSTTPAVVAGLAEEPKTMEWLAELTDIPQIRGRPTPQIPLDLSLAA